MRKIINQHTLYTIDHDIAITFRKIIDTEMMNGGMKQTEEQNNNIM